jgi:N-acetylmuramic acid 6-phosphate etherase
MAQIIEHECDLYKNGQILSYQSDSYYSISILTDTTERSPTFSLTPFVNKYQPQEKESWCNLKILHKGEPEK